MQIPYAAPSVIQGALQGVQYFNEVLGDLTLAASRFSGGFWSLWAACLIALVGATAARASEPASKPTPFELWRSADDGLTIKLGEAVEHTLTKSGNFVQSRGKKPGTLMITFPQAVTAVPDGKRVDVDYEVAFSTTDGRKLATIKSGCREDELTVCVENIAATAYTASQWISTAPFVLPRDGDYLSTAYIATLATTKSHKKAWATGAPQAITVSRDKRGLVLSVNWNWHEGDDTVFDPEKPTDLIGSDHAFFPGDTTHFRFQELSKTLTYQYVGSELKFITERILTGTYTDAHGRQYLFGSDGIARWPDRTFRYKLYTDMVFEDGDEFYDVDATRPNDLKAYGFAWKDDHLFLYKLICDDRSPDCSTDRKHPIAVLRKIASAKP